MKERPILFSGAMVRAILDGSKTQTRRVVNSRGRYDVEEMAHSDDAVKHLLSPYGQPGDLLYVRETWAADSGFNHWSPLELTESVIASSELWHRAGPEGFHEPASRFRRAAIRGKWRPSIFMPKAFSRIDLRVTDVRVERVQDISEADAYAEGVSGGDWMGDPVGEFEKLWDSINVKRSPWSDNPWVWAVTFERTES